MTRRDGGTVPSAAAVVGPASSVLALLVAVVVALVLAAGQAAAQAGAEVQILRNDVTDGGQVSLNVAVDAPAEGVRGSLSPSAFTVAEDGQPRDAEVARVPADALDVLVVLDNSAAAAQTLATAQGAAVDFALRLPAATRVGVVDIGGEPEVLAAPTRKRRQVLAGIGELRLQTGTALWDGIAEAVASLPDDGDRRRVLVVLSASDDTASAATLEEAAAALQAAEVTLLGVELPGPDGSGIVERLADVAGGSATTLTSTDQLVGTLDDMVRWLSNLYDVTFEAQGQGDTTVTVGVEDGALAASTEITVTLPAAQAGTGDADNAGDAADVGAGDVGADDPAVDDAAGQAAPDQAPAPAGEPARGLAMRSLLSGLAALALLGVAVLALRRRGGSGWQAARTVSTGASKALAGAGQRARTGATTARRAVAAGTSSARGGAGAGLRPARAAVVAGATRARGGTAVGLAKARRTVTTGGSRLRAGAGTGLATARGGGARAGRGIAGMLATTAAALRRAAGSASAALARRPARPAAAAPQSISASTAPDAQRPARPATDTATDTSANRLEAVDEPGTMAPQERERQQADTEEIGGEAAWVPTPRSSVRTRDPRQLTPPKPAPQPASPVQQRAPITAAVAVLASLQGQRLRRVWTPVNRSAGAAVLVGQVVEDVRPQQVGVEVVFRSGAALQVQLGGGGQWHLYRTGDSWQMQWQSRWREVSVVLFGQDWTAVCAGATGCAVRPPPADFFPEGGR